LKNPREVIRALDESNHIWRLNYIFYNNKFFGGTRNEHRLTGISGFLRKASARAGDFVEISRNEDSSLYTISLVRSNDKDRSKKRTFKSKTRIVSIGNWEIVGDLE
jgi:hypothetical protein